MKIDNTLAIDSFNSAKFNNIKNSKNNDVELKKQTNAFEAFFIKTILDISIKSDNALFPKDAGSKIYNSMYNDTMSQALSGNFGFSKLLFNYLKQRS